ncbi:extracellular solute-binding protein [Planctomyces sp. SH-PL62]|uniref:extracellular solute-binding protein n=1 Tax=Planctomyces sp. SH-PL62 TaxID=1636152 RepID=UPI00078BCF12|nr:extracellular solute-binding protein [Planctomyces sp. SH-PL62]AMV36749.1 putative binding protein component of ABC iron transporter precursor [Planctomyces sp. SH-PL62]
MRQVTLGLRLAGFSLLAGFGLAGVARAEDGSVVVYSALDREFSDPILKDLAGREGLKLRPKYDVESTKTVGLVNAIVAESVNTRCDLFWNNEILNTIRLKRKGLLKPFQPSAAGDVPATFKDPDGTWYGFAARARVLIVNTRFVPKPERPRGIADLASFRWNGRVGIAKPLFGTTATHAACLFAAWGDAKARDYFKSLKANDVRVLAGNRQVAAAVASGQLAFGLTDTDDAMLEVEAGAPVEIIYPDREPGGLGTLFIPNTLAFVKDAPHPEAARKLADAILSSEVENRLADGPSAQIPLLKSATRPARVETPATIPAMQVDFQAAADAWDRAAAFLAQEFAD